MNNKNGNNPMDKEDVMNDADKDVLASIANAPVDSDTYTDDGEDDVLIDELFSKKPAHTVPAPAKVPSPSPAKPAQKQNSGTNVRRDARYSMTPAEINTLAAAAEDAIAGGRFGVALDSVFFTAGDARESLRKKLNIRIPLGSAEDDLPVIATAALIESYLGTEDISGEDIEEKLRLIISSSEDENGVRPSEKQVELRVFECVLIMCVQAEQCGNHREMKAKLYEGENSFLRDYLAKNIDTIMGDHRRSLSSFYNSVKVQSAVVGGILEEYILSSKTAMHPLRRIFAESTPVMITSIVSGVLCLIAIIVFAVLYNKYDNAFDILFSDSFVSKMVILMQVLFSLGLAGLAFFIYTGGERKEPVRPEKENK